jgi:fructosamine-3-kinase
VNAAEAVRHLFGRPAVEARRLSGGDLSAVFRVTLEDGSRLIAKQAPNAVVEAGMLFAIRAAGAPAPEVIGADDEWLLMADVEAGDAVGTTWPDLAAVLGRLHAATGEDYGWPIDHAFGAVAIDNRPAADWPSFWAERRLFCHLPFVDVALGRRIERLAARLPDLLPARPRASLLHGDLWGGNVMASAGRVAALIDPACYHGDREVDVAMLTLFDRPPPSFFQQAKLDPGWEERQPIYRIWPLLVHLRLFGDSYAGSVGTALASVGC